MRRIIEAAPEALVVLDEAYVHYSGTGGYIHLVDDYANLVVLRTFSKAFGLAGLRAGFGVGPKPVAGAVVVPAALAVAEEIDASGLAFLEAVVVGYEAMGRAGLAVGPVSHMLAGFHPTSMSGVFGAAAAAAHLRGLDAEGINHAFGIAASLASGTMEFASSGGMAKRIHAARASEGGVMAADGFEGARDGLAGRYGFCRIVTDDPQPQRLTEQMGERWMIDEVTVKPYPSCSDLHPMVQATSELVAIHGLTADDIDRIVVHCTPIADPALAALQAKVAAVVPTPVFDATYAWKQGARVDVTRTDGTVLERTVNGQKGSMHAPLTDNEIDQEFGMLADGRLDPGIPELVRSLPGRPIRDLTHRLRPV